MHYRKACTLDAHSLQKTFASLTIFINFVSPYAESALCVTVDTLALGYAIPAIRVR